MKASFRMIICLVIFLGLMTRGDADDQSLTTTLIRQLIQQQFHVEEMTRSNGQSGLKAIRNTKTGTRPYFSNSFVGSSIASIHNHGNNIRTVGMGEFIGVLNGVEFRTRHNDYRLKMKSRTSSEYGATEDIPFPPVPLSVTELPTLEEQIEEMRAYFKAWRDQDHTERDYRPYFRPVMCYLEGAWTNSGSGDLDESFESDRHFLDASSWLDLLDKIRYSAYTGTKSNLENFAYLPTAILDVINGTIPVLAQWNYKILCHPIQRDIPLGLLRVVDDLKVRMQYKRTLEELKSSRAARFQLNYADRIQDPWREQGGMWAVLDEIMSEIPGADNYMGNLTDSSFGLTARHFRAKKSDGDLNAAFFHRRFKVSEKGADGVSSRTRGFSDDSLFMAMTSQPKVAGMGTEECTGRRRQKTCQKVVQKWTYAVPLELIYMTPLNSWNPLNIEYKGGFGTELGKTVYGTDKSRDGSNSVDRAFNGTNSKVYYITPADFFEEEFDFDPADTTKEDPYFLNADGDLVQTKASGIRVFLPNIPGVGVMRQRFPIMPMHGEGSAVWRELEAIKDILLEPTRYRDMLREEPNADEIMGEDDGVYEEYFELRPSSPLHGAHEHELEISAEQMAVLYEGGEVSVTTSEAEGHSHELEVKIITRKSGRQLFLIHRCDGLRRCWDGHSRVLNRIMLK